MLIVGWLAGLLATQSQGQTDASPGAGAPTEAGLRVDPTRMIDDKLTAEVRRVLDDPQLRGASVGVCVMRPGATWDDRRMIVDIEADRPLIPASNMKLLSTTLAIERLGPSFRFRTMLLRRGQQIALVGDGDPTLGDSERLRAVGWGPATLFEKWAESMPAEVLSIESLVVDDSVFEPASVHPGWPAGQHERPYCAQVGGLNLNTNCLDVFVAPRGGSIDVRAEPVSDVIELVNALTMGNQQSVWMERRPGSNRVTVRGTVNASNRIGYRVTIDDPTRFTAGALAHSLRASGRKVGDVRVDRTIRSQLLNPDRAGWDVLAVFETELQAVLVGANKDSNNLFAEALLKRSVVTQEEAGSWSRGSAALASMTTELDLDASGMTFDDGSGLSRGNRVTPHLLATVLTKMHHHERPDVAEMYRNSLAVAGVDGTLDRRFPDALRGRVFAKTGYIRGVSALSGYVVGRSGGVHVFSVVLNDLREDRIRVAKLAQERIVEAIDRLNP
jgi:D-alanyl-D-alanine carboxypeptidase/D-alanyl-D-alanine-endopeptidase (penicillin-binding protein 4)